MPESHDRLKEVWKWTFRQVSILSIPVTGIGCRDISGAPILSLKLDIFTVAVIAYCLLRRFEQIQKDCVQVDFRIASEVQSDPMAEVAAAKRTIEEQMAREGRRCYHSALTGYAVMRGSGVSMVRPPAIAWQMSILSKGSL